MVLTDNKVALRQLELANAALVSGTASRSYAGESLAKDGKFHPRVLTLGGDHTITLPLLRGVASVYGPVSVIHFDSHLGEQFRGLLKWKVLTYLIQTHGSRNLWL